VVEAAEDTYMPVPQLSRHAFRAFIAAQHRRGVHRRPIEIVPCLCFFTLGIHVVISTQSNRLFKLPEEKEKSPREWKNLERLLFTPRLTVYKFTVPLLINCEA
jgi:hypothetical protein